jgi:hypothetical protein
VTADEKAARAAALVELGRAIYGEDWQTPMGVAFDVPRLTIRRWAAGEGRLPTDGMLAEVARAAIARGDDIALLDRVVIIRRYAGSNQ